MTHSPRTLRLVRQLRSWGFVHPWSIVIARRKAGVNLATCLALLQMETGDGRNIYGHDRVDNPAPKGGKVTRDNYRAYKASRQAGLGMQGVGGCQLTYWSIQDMADQLGGCWVPRHNYTVGFRWLKKVSQPHGLWAGYRAYNGTGLAASAYANLAMSRRRVWNSRLARAGLQ